MGPCAGGAVYSPAMTDFIFMVKETSHMFITGPDVIKTVTGEEVEFEELGGAMTHNTKSGVAHFAADERGAVPGGRALPDVLPARSTTWRCRRGWSPTTTPIAMDEALDTIVPDDPHKPYDMRDVISLIVDDGEFFEVHAALRAEHRRRLRPPRRLSGRGSSATSRGTSPACSTSTPR